jgi:hypothetical protein
MNPQHNEKLLEPTPASQNMQRYFSGIYWHFTGTPRGVPWHELKKPSEILDNDRQPKPVNEQVEIVKKILESKKLLAQCTERIDEQTFSSEFCCVTDIPLKDLPHFARFYGCTAIGFNHEAIHREFFPVWYIPSGHLPYRESHHLTPEELTEVTSRNLDPVRLNKIMITFNSRAAERTLDEKEVTAFALNKIKITDFSVNPDETFYAEREWRKLGCFSFELQDVAAVVIPGQYIPEVRKCLDSQGYIGTSLFAWQIIQLA